MDADNLEPSLYQRPIEGTDDHKSKTRVNTKRATTAPHLSHYCCIGHIINVRYIYNYTYLNLTPNSFSLLRSNSTKRLPPFSLFPASHIPSTRKIPLSYSTFINSFVHSWRHAFSAPFALSQILIAGKMRSHSRAKTVMYPSTGSVHVTFSRTRFLMPSTVNLTMKSNTRPLITLFSTLTTLAFSAASTLTTVRLPSALHIFCFNIPHRLSIRFKESIVLFTIQTQSWLLLSPVWSGPELQTIQEN